MVMLLCFSGLVEGTWCMKRLRGLLFISLRMWMYNEEMFLFYQHTMGMSNSVTCVCVHWWWGHQGEEWRRQA